MAPEVRVLGRIAYGDALALQQETAEAVKAGKSGGTVFILEHDPVITLGGNKPINKVLYAPPGVSLVQTDRGGGATAHNPGQLVVYPVVGLRSLGFGVKSFVAWVLEMGRALLESYGVAAECRQNPLGLWVGERKIASLGIHVSCGVATHGIAINLDNDLTLFNAIVPCGLAGVAMTSAAAETGAPVDMAEAMARMAAIATAGVGRLAAA
ncbi:lipoate-protein ligase B [Solidesulfovibrio fructosivorans JJ]]|uniref:Octanoyltransferase n=1 Tax=Solidesulfovibrio fructosivorans JJ] TaxID=596151 RepID=E1K2C6_SOLFR|nr:lipoyl(octanoyl) transferase LipB [Solidesulfovibrio fructosivorans]EFL49246.1 lipoate-protein ligase B [Solidesulfovibrio fructosivorans JJ]]